MKDEMKILVSNQTWKLVKLPIKKKSFHKKWTYHVKDDHNDSKRYKDQLGVKGFQQKKNNYVQKICSNHEA